MTPFALLEALKAFIEQETKDLILPCRVERGETGPKERAPEIHLMRLPNREAQTKRAPYVLLQFLKSTDEHPVGVTVESKSQVRIVAATYAENEKDGALAVLNVLSRIRLALLKSGMVGRQFVLCTPLETVVYPDDTHPYYFGEMMTTWRMPPIESEVRNLGIRNNRKRGAGD